jgi:RNA polymerase sigma factor (sigma-70 family)
MDIYDGDGAQEFPAHASRVRASVRRTTRSYGVPLQEDRIDDLVQETFLTLLTRGAEKRVASVPAYLTRIARNVTIDTLRHRSAKKRDEQKTTSLSDASAMLSPAPTPEEELILRDEFARGVSVLRRLLSSQACRILLLLYVKGLTSREASSAVGLSPSAVDTAAHRARRLLALEGIHIPGRSCRE